MIRAVLDTNVLVSAIVGLEKDQSTPGELFRRWQGRAYELVVSRVILDELERTLLNPYFQTVVTAEQRHRVISSLRRQAALIPITVTVRGVVSDPDDDLILATAVSGTVDYLVTGDRALQALGSYQNVEIVSPRQFLAVLEQKHDP